MSLVHEDNLAELVTRHMRADYTTLRAHGTVGDALQSLRGGHLAEKIVYFYVIDDDGRLVGVVPTRRLLMSQLDVPLAQIMVGNVISIPFTMTVLDACEFFVMHRLLAFPVVDADNRLIGVVDVSMFTDEMLGVNDEMSGATERQAQENVFQLIGIHVARGRRGSPLAGFKDRFPWLLCNIGGGLACAFIAGRYEQFLDHVIILALFIPVVLTLAEGVSMQSMTITLQGLRDGRLRWGELRRPLRQELLTAVLLGAASGAAVALVALAWKRHAAAAVAIGGSIALAIVTACVLGVLLPTLVRAFRGDPKIAAGPMVLAAADIATLLFYFNIAQWMLR